MPRLKGIPPNVVVFGFVSFLTDVSADMIYPLLPIFLTQVLGAKEGFLGLVEGAAESTAALFMLFSGILADRARDRSKLVLAGYGLSSFSRPLVALAWSPWVVLFVRMTDRIGKGIRTSPRDALIADSVEPAYRGRAFGLQRSMDNAGAVTGPLIATFLLATVLTDLRKVFAIAAVPGILAVCLVLWKVREVLPPGRELRKTALRLEAPRGRLRIYLAILFLFLLSCSTDAFLLLRAKEAGVPVAYLPILWMALQAVKALTNVPLGHLSDRFGRRPIILAGWVVYALVYLGFGFARSAWQIAALFILYGFFYGFTEGTERALLADFSQTGERGQVYGWYYLVVGMAALPASLLFGFIWQAAGSAAAFTFSASISGLAAALLFLFLRAQPDPPAVR